MKITSLYANHMHRSLGRSALLIPLLLACFVFAPETRAACQEGCLTNQNTVLGDDALFSVTFGFDNTAVGFNALLSNTEGFNNTANGYQALFSNTTGGDNTAVGVRALNSNTTGGDNTATGINALLGNTTGNDNAAYGTGALQNNDAGSNNTATGVLALWNNIAGGNVANGFQALYSNTTGGDNTAIGQNALNSNTAGNNNIALGSGAGTNLTTGNNNIVIGNAGIPADSRTIRIGTTPTHRNTFICGIFGAAVNGSAVVVNSNGKLGITASSARFKDAVEPMGEASEAILALKPVTFRYKHEVDPDGIPQFGLVAEDVEKVNPALVARDAEGQVYTVRYEAVNAMLLNEFLKEHKAFVEEQRKVQEQGAMIARQQKQIETLTVGLQKVSAQLELSKSAPQTVQNSQ